MKVSIKMLEMTDLDKDFSTLEPDIVIEAKPGDEELTIENPTPDKKALLEDFINNFSFPTIPTLDEDAWKWLHYFAGRISGNMKYLVEVEKTEEDNKEEKAYIKSLQESNEQVNKEIVKEEEDFF
jgi:hypothetical protein